MIYLLIGSAIADVLTTLLVLRNGRELNPVARLMGAGRNNALFVGIRAGLVVLLLFAPSVVWWAAIVPWGVTAA